MTRYRPDESAIEREQVEYVFGLTGGELADTKWECAVAPREHGGTWDYSFAYWYEGVPDYCERDEREAWDEYNTRTVLAFGGGCMSGPQPWLVDDAGAWVLVATFSSSGETECPGQHGDRVSNRIAGNIVRREQCVLTEAYPRRAECSLCGERVGTKHGYIYIGEGYEAVYSLVEESTHVGDDEELHA